MTDSSRLEDWSFPQPMDYIHVRLTAGVWVDFERDCAQKAFASLEPGGWFEAQEILPEMLCDDGTMPADWPLKRLLDDLRVRDRCDESGRSGDDSRDEVQCRVRCLDGTGPSIRRTRRTEEGRGALEDSTGEETRD